MASAFKTTTPEGVLQVHDDVRGIEQDNQVPSTTYGGIDSSVVIGQKHRPRFNNRGMRAHDHELESRQIRGRSCIRNRAIAGEFRCHGIDDFRHTEPVAKRL